MIFLEALNIILNAFTYVLGWFFELYDAAGALGLWQFCVYSFLLYRFILAPFFGLVASSDKAVAARAAKERRDAEHAARMGYYRSGKAYYDSRKR